MAPGLWKSKEQRMQDDATELLRNAQQWIAISGGVEYLSEQELKWVEEQKIHAQSVFESAAAARYGWEDLVRYVVAPLLIIGGPLAILYLTLGRALEKSMLPRSIEAWWSFPLFCAVTVPGVMLLEWGMYTFDRLFVKPWRDKQLAATRAAQQEIELMCDSAVKRWEAS